MTVVVIRSNGSSRQILTRAFVAASAVRMIQIHIFQREKENEKIEKNPKKRQEIVSPIVATILARSVTVVQQAFVHI